MKKTLFVLSLVAMLSTSCTFSADPEESPSSPSIPLSDVAELFASLPFDLSNMKEVHDAVMSSSENGYDDEYTVSTMFSNPGAGIGDGSEGTRSGEYATTFRELIRSYLSEKKQTRAAGMDLTAEEYEYLLKTSDNQIYWPHAGKWDGKTLPIITFAPGDDSQTNMGYELVGEAADRRIRVVTVTESLARERPVWIINNNEDSMYDTIEILQRKDPSIGGGGGAISRANDGSVKAGSANMKTLVLKDMIVHKNFDSWFAGASELMVKAGAVEDFTASTEAELKLFFPSITDFLIVVKRDELEKVKKLNTVMVSSWSDQLQDIAFMLTEDDGGTQTSWKCDATVKVKSKSYGVEMDIPIRTRDDIIWRGKLSSSFFERKNGLRSNFGEVELSFEFI